jgi:hypothetical protein
LFVLLYFSFGQCVVCSSSIYGFWLPLWYLQTLFRVNLSSFSSNKLLKFYIKTFSNIKKRVTIKVAEIINFKLTIVNQLHENRSSLITIEARTKCLPSFVHPFFPLLMSVWWLFSANSAIVQQYHGENKLIFNDMMMRSVLY